MSNTAKRGRRADDQEARDFSSQTEEQRKTVIRQIRKLNEDLLEKKDKIKSGNDNDEFKKLLKEATEIVREVRGTQEAIEDGKLFRALCQTVREISEDTNINEEKFNVDEYIEKLGRHVNASRDNKNNIKLTKNQFLGLGEKFSCKFKRTPVFTFILGAVDTEAAEDKTRKQRERKVGRQRNLVPTKTAIVERSQADGQRTSKLVEATKKMLIEEYKQQGRKPVNYFKFVIDPESFGNTVENMFHISFLVKQRAVHMNVSNLTGLPSIEPVTGSTVGDQGESEGKNQAIISISYEDWEDLKEALNVTKAAIIHNENLRMTVNSN